MSIKSNAVTQSATNVTVPDRYGNKKARYTPDWESSPLPEKRPFSATPATLAATNMRPMSFQKNTAFWVLGMFILLGLSSLGYLLGDAAIRVKEYERTVTVKGLSSASIRPTS